MRLRRETGGPGPFLEWRVRLMGAGAIVALIGFWARADWLVSVAIVLLFAGFVLRFVGRDGAGPGEDSESGGAEEQE